MIKNPVLKGFNPNPCICRKGDDYYAAVSSFEWFPDFDSKELGLQTEFFDARIPAEDVPVYLRLHIEGRKTWFDWSYDGEKYIRIGGIFGTTKFSDEYCRYGEFTGIFVGLACTDGVKHSHYADFDFFRIRRMREQ